MHACKLGDLNLQMILTCNSYIALSCIHNTEKYVAMYIRMHMYFRSRY